MHPIPLVCDSEPIPHFLHWNETCHMDVNVDVDHFEMEKLWTMLGKGNPDLLHEIQDNPWNEVSGERIDPFCFEKAGSMEESDNSSDNNSDDSSEDGDRKDEATAAAT